MRDLLLPLSILALAVATAFHAVTPAQAQTDGALCELIRGTTAEALADGAQSWMRSSGRQHFETVHHFGQHNSVICGW